MRDGRLNILEKGFVSSYNNIFEINYLLCLDDLPEIIESPSTLITKGKATIQVFQTLTLKLTIRKQTNNSILLKSVSYCYCYCSMTNEILRSQSGA